MNLKFLKIYIEISTKSVINIKRKGILRKKNIYIYKECRSKKDLLREKMKRRKKFLNKTSQQKKQKRNRFDNNINEHFFQSRKNRIRERKMPFSKASDYVEKDPRWINSLYTLTHVSTN